ncbi:MAG: hypothetical protein ABI794_15785, partial [Betaproteobacteria bacterium]
MRTSAHRSPTFAGTIKSTQVNSPFVISGDEFMVVATLGCGFVRTSAIAGALLFILAPSAARAQLNPGDIERLKDAAARQGALLAQRIAGTTGFEGCDLQFVHTHRDTEARKGELVKYAGSFRASYASGKAPKLHLQVRGSDLFVASDGRVSESPFVPAAVTLSLGNVMFKSSPPAKDAACEKGAVCAVVD